MPEDNPIKIHGSAFIPVLTQIVTKLLAMVGVFLVTHGFLSNEQLDSALPAVAQEVVGALLALGAVAWAAYRSKRSNDQKLDIVNDPRTYVPTDVAVVTAPSSPPPPIALLLMLLLPALAGCATLSSRVDDAFYKAQITFRAVQEITLNTCTNPTPALVKPCGRAIDLLHEGAKAEAVGYLAVQANRPDDARSAVAVLISLPAQLSALGVLEAR